MRIALFSDVHGNLSGLEAVLTSIDQQSVDQVVFVGDLCLVGPRPSECLQLLRERQIAAVYGNTDDMVLGRQQSPERLTALVHWTAAQLTTTDREWLLSLPFSITFNPTADPATALSIVHANPRDVNQIIFPAETEQQTRYGTIRQTDAELDGLLNGLEAQMLAFGHLHIPSIRPWRDCLLLNVSSVNLPGDGDARAKYALASWDGSRWTAEHVPVAYDIAAEIDAYRAAQPPGWLDAVAALEAHGIIAQNV